MNENNENNGNSIQHHTPTDTGILAVALRALADFSPALVPVGKNSQAVLATCPVCIGEPGSLRSLRVEAVDVPKRLNWYCSLHRGGFNGVQYALSKHQSAQVCDLALQGNSVCTNSNAAPEVDPAADHQKEHRCSNQRLIFYRIKDLGRLEAVPGRCRHCVGCTSWLKAGRVSRLIDVSADWDSVFLVSTEGPKAFTALSAKLRRHNLERRTDDCHDPVQYVSVPVDGGRGVLTNDSTVAGSRIEPGDVRAAITSLVNRMIEGGRISYSYSAKRKPKKKQDLSRERVGASNLMAREAAAVCLRHGVPVVPRGVRERGRKPLPTWDISSLSPDKLLALYVALGIRITKRLRL